MRALLLYGGFEISVLGSPNVDTTYRERTSSSLVLITNPNSQFPSSLSSPCQCSRQMLTVDFETR